MGQAISFFFAYYLFSSYDSLIRRGGFLPLDTALAEIALRIASHISKFNLTVSEMSDIIHCVLKLKLLTRQLADLHGVQSSASRAAYNCSICIIWVT